MKSIPHDERQTYLRSSLLGTTIRALLPLRLLLSKESKPSAGDLEVLALIGGVIGFLIGSSTGRTLVQRRRQCTDASDTPRALTELPVSLVCPKCGSTEARPESQLTKQWLEKSRVCQHCKTIYVLPTQPLAAVPLLIGGLSLMASAIAVIYVGWRFGIATQHVMLFEVLFYAGGFALAKVGWQPLRRGFCALYREGSV